MKSKTMKIIAVTLLVGTLAFPATSHAWRGWWGPGVFAGGVILGSALANPYYYYPPPPAYYPPPSVYVYQQPQVVYTPPPPPPSYAPPAPAAPPPQGSGQWIEVPGQTVNNVWVPPHKVWVADGH